MKFLQTIRAKMILFSIVITSLFLLITVFGIIGINQIVKSANRIQTDYVPIIEAVHYASSALRDGIDLLHNARMHIKDPEDFDEIRKYEGQFKKSMIAFDMYAKAVIWGSKSGAFAKSSGGLTQAMWIREGLEKRLIVKRAPHKIQQLIGQADIYYAGFANNALRTMRSHKKALRFELSNQIAEAGAEHKKADGYVDKVDTYGNYIKDIFKNVNFELSAYLADAAADIENAQRATLRAVVTLSIFIFIGVTLFTLIFPNRLIVNPIRALTKGVQAIGKGELDERISIRDGGEIGQLADSFNKMVGDIKKTTTSIDHLNREIAERQKAEELAQKSEELFRTAVIGLPVGVFVLDSQGVFTLSEGQSLEILDIFPQKVLGKFVEDIFSDRPEVLDCIKDALRGRGSKPIVQVGDRTVQIRSSPVLNQDQKVESAIGVIIDMTERKKIEDQLKQANEDLAANEKALKNMLYDLRKAHEELKETQTQLIQSEKLASIGQLAAGVAHEVKNPLAIILLSIESLEEKIKSLGKENVRYIEMIKDAAERANKVVVELLNFSRQSEVNLELLDIHQVIDKTIDLVANSARINNINVVKEYSTEGYTAVQGDATQLGQVFLNLFANAIDAIGSNGTISVKTYALEDNRQVGIEVCNTGSAIPQEIIPKIFEPFFTTKEQGKGTGLGLSTVYMIIERHNGKIRVESKEGVGTKFIITLPASNA